MNANERIKQTQQAAFSKSNVCVSSLGQYQNQLERAKTLDADLTCEARDFRGYSPSSTLKIKKNLTQYDDWDSEPKTKDVIHNPLFNHSQNNWHSSEYLRNLSIKRTADPKLKRSQTVIVKQPAISEFNVEGEIDLRDFYQRRYQLRQSEEKRLNNYSSALSVHQNGIQKNCDSVSDNKEPLYHPNSLSVTIRDNNDSVNNSIANRMNCYKTANFYANGKSELASENSENGRVLLNPLARNKSIKINHFDTLKQPQRLKPEEVDGRLCDTEGLSGKKSKNSFRKMFATISAGTKFPRVFLGRAKKNQRAKLNLEELSETADTQQSNSSLTSTLSSTPTHSSSSSSSAITGLNNVSNSIHKRSSEISSDSDSFVIPRPRLIVPVHTYARKRRTGNLASSKSFSNKATNCDKNKGKTTEPSFLKA